MDLARIQKNCIDEKAISTMSMSSLLPAILTQGQMGRYLKWQTLRERVQSQDGSLLVDLDHNPMARRRGGHLWQSMMRSRRLCRG